MHNIRPAEAFTVARGSFLILFLEWVKPIILALALGYRLKNIFPSMRLELYTPDLKQQFQVEIPLLMAIRK